jgi:hypothetical protein
VLTLFSNKLVGFVVVEGPGSNQISELIQFIRYHLADFSELVDGYFD